MLPGEMWMVVYMNEHVQWPGIIWYKAPWAALGWICVIYKYPYPYYLLLLYILFYNMALAAIFDWWSKGTCTLEQEFLMRNILWKVVLHIAFCQKTPQYICQDACGGHLGFMHEQDLKVEQNVINDFLIRNIQRQVVMHIVFWRKMKKMFSKMIVAVILYLCTNSAKVSAKLVFLTSKKWAGALG